MRAGEKLEELEETAASLNRRWERDTRRLERQLEDLANTVARIHRRVTAVEADLEDLKGRVYDLESDVRGLQ